VVVLDQKTMGFMWGRHAAGCMDIYNENPPIQAKV